MGAVTDTRGGWPLPRDRAVFAAVGLAFEHIHLLAWLRARFHNAICAFSGVSGCGVVAAHVHAQVAAIRTSPHNTSPQSGLLCERPAAANIYTKHERARLSLQTSIITPPQNQQADTVHLPAPRAALAALSRASSSCTGNWPGSRALPAPCRALNCENEACARLAASSMPGAPWLHSCG